MSNEYNGKKRSELPDSVFGIPQERKYPMPDEKHTRSAIKLFNHVDPKYEEQLAKAVIKNMKKYNIDGSVVGPNNRLRKYLPKDMIKKSAVRPLIYTWERANIPEYSVIRESSHKSDFSYSGINTSAEKSEFKRNFREVFKEDPTESSVNYMQMIKYKGDLVGYIGFSRYKEGKKKYLGIGNFMILKRYQRSGMGSKVISDIIDRYKDNYDEIYCYVDKDNTNAIAFYKKIAKVNTDNLTKYGYYVTLYSKSIGESAMLESSMPEEIPNDIRELLRRLNSYDYGYIKNGQKIKGMKNFFEDYKSLTISEFEKYQIGVCWDYVHYEAYWFAKNHYKYETFYIQVQDEDNDCPSHTYLVFYLPNSSKVYYFESSWGKYQGIEAFDNIIKLHNTIKERHIESARSKCDPKTYFRNRYDAKSSRWEHLSCGDYMVKVSNGKVQVNESYIEEGYFRSTDNLEFNLDKWSKSGNHNLLYITGISGSGKTTLAKEMCKKYKAEYIELDKFTLGIVKGLDRWFENVNNGTYEVHPLLKEYFSQLDHLTTNGSWSKPDMGNEHDKFLTWLIKKVKGNGTLYIVEGAQFFMKLSNMDPDLIKGEPLIVVGTSAFKSWIRRIKRDTNNDETISRFIYHLKKDVPMLFKYYFSNEKDLQKYIKNMQSNVNESVSSTVSKDHKQKGYISLSSLKKVHITESVINKYKKEYPVLRHVRCKDTNEYICDGYMWFKENDLVCYVGSCQYTDDHTKWIVSLEIIPKYRGYGLSNQILDFCVKSMKCKYLSVNKNNELAKKIYDKYGFKVYHEDKTMYYMTLDSIIKESSSRKITTVVFDLGDVLIKSNMQEKLRKNPKIPNQQIYPLLEKWFDDDLDLLSKEEYIDTISKRLAPDFSDIVPDIVDAFSDIEVLSYTIPTLKDLKERGYNIYYLSNWSRWGVEILRENNKLDFLSLFDGGLFSYEVGVKKPDRKIYDAFLKKFKINPKEAIFVDNKKKNIDAAEKFGIKGVLFSNEKDLQKYIKNMQSNINESSPILPQNTGITTVIFDIGDVLVSANIKDYLVADSEVPNEIVDELLKLWFIDKDEVDDTMDLDTYREIVNKRMGVEFSKYIPKLFRYNVECVTAFDYTIPMIQDLKNKGYKVYYLSNWSAWTHDLLQEAGKFDFLKLMDGGVFSYDAGYMKPNEEIYKILLNKYKINPEEAVFFDDREENIEAANKLGIHGIHFPRHDASIVYNNLYGRKLAKAIYEDMDNIRYDFDHSYNDKVFGIPSIQEYGTTGGTIVGANQPDSVYIVNYMQNNVFSGYKEPKQAICKKGMNQMYTTKNGKAIPVDIDKFKEEASDISVFRFKETPILSFDKIIENASVDGDFYMLLTGDYPTNQREIEYDNRFIQEDNFFDKLDDITYCTESTIIGQIEATDYPYMKILTESMEGRCWNYYRDINGVFAMNELTGLRTPSYEDITDIPNSQIQLIERGTVYFGD